MSYSQVPGHRHSAEMKAGQDEERKELSKHLTATVSHLSAYLSIPTSHQSQILDALNEGATDDTKTGTKEGKSSAVRAWILTGDMKVKLDRLVDQFNGIDNQLENIARMTEEGLATTKKLKIVPLSYRGQCCGFRIDPDSFFGFYFARHTEVVMVILLVVITAFRLQWQWLVPAAAISIVACVRYGCRYESERRFG